MVSSNGGCMQQEWREKQIFAARAPLLRGCARERLGSHCSMRRWRAFHQGNRGRQAPMQKVFGKPFWSVLWCLEGGKMAVVEALRLGQHVDGILSGTFEAPRGGQAPTGNRQRNQTKGTLSGVYETPSTPCSMGESVAKM